MVRRSLLVAVCGLLAALVLVSGMTRPSAARICCGMSCCPGNGHADESDADDVDQGGGATVSRAPCCKRAPTEPGRGQAPSPPRGDQLRAFALAAVPACAVFDVPPPALQPRVAATSPRAPVARTIWLELRSLLI